MRRETRWVALAVGLAATVVSATGGLSLLQRQLHSAGRLPCASAVEDGPRPHKRITIGPTRLRYLEGDDVLELSLEMTSRYDIVYVPTARRWSQRMPEWARDRRDDIMREIKRLAAGHPIRWVDDDT